MADLEALAARVEGLSGPDRETDGWIKALLNPDERTVVDHEPGRFPRKAIYGPITLIMENIGGTDGADYIAAPRYTASLDAAMTLAPEGWKRINIDPNGRANVRLGDRCAVSAATPALALVAAALRAKAP